MLKPYWIQLTLWTHNNRHLILSWFSIKPPACSDEGFGHRPRHHHHHQQQLVTGAYSKHRYRPITTERLDHLRVFARPFHRLRHLQRDQWWLMVHRLLQMVPPLLFPPATGGN